MWSPVGTKAVIHLPLHESDYKQTRSQAVALDHRGAVITCSRERWSCDLLHPLADGPSVLLGVLMSSLFGSLLSPHFFLTRIFGVDYVVLTSVSQGGPLTHPLFTHTGKCAFAVCGFIARTQASFGTDGTGVALHTAVVFLAFSLP